ncbi:response regulator [Glaciecola sp.]|uniref:GGDEF domain-containing response regulator n=1 Tax=Glaciecola sp. MF2-115 TaxID=3384827 RepID=UPI0039895757
MNNKSKVLVIDDDITNLEIVSQILKAEFTVKTHHLAPQGIEEIQEFAPDLILMDVKMPGMDGFSVCTELKQNPKTKHIPVIFLSAFAIADFQEKGFAVGAVDYITKPFIGEILKARIRAHCQTHEKLTNYRKQIQFDEAVLIENNQKFHQQLSFECARARRANGSLGLLLFSIDDFAYKLADYEAEEMTTVLIEMTNMISKAAARPYDQCARVSENEFAVILPEADFEGTLLVANRINFTLKKDRLCFDHESQDPITITIGASAITPKSANEFIALYEDAKSALTRTTLSAKQDTVLVNK